MVIDMKDIIDSSYTPITQNDLVNPANKDVKCANADDMVSTMLELAKENIETDFLYKKDGEKGLWLEILKVKE